MDGKTIAAIITALGLAYSQVRGAATVRSDVSAGVVEFVNAELDQRDKELADLKAQVAYLQGKLEAKR